MLLAAVPSGLMLSTTTHLTTDIVAMPLLWVLPLGLYLLSFSVAFSERRGSPTGSPRRAADHPPRRRASPLPTGRTTRSLSAPLGLILLFTVAVVLHGELYPPAPRRRSSHPFYLAMSVGGALGGFFCALIAPLVFDWAYEHPILLPRRRRSFPQMPLRALAARLADARALLAGLAFLLSFVDKRRCSRGSSAMLGRWPAILVSLLALVCDRPAQACSSPASSR